MGDSSEGSSSAARSAQESELSPQQGLFSRIAAAFGGETAGDAPSGQNDNTHDTEGENAAVVNGYDTGMANLRQMRVEDVAIPRVEIISVPVDIELDALIEVFRESGNTRLPVYDGTLDSPLGLVHMKDIALNYGFSCDETNEFDLRSLLRPLIYAPPSMPIGVLLQKMQTDRRHMALVIDEYGGVDGLATIEDLIEQVIGEIEDEHDVDDEEFWFLEKPGCYLALARAPLDEFEAEIGLKLVEGEDQEEIDTLGGVVFMETGRVPARGEVIPHPSGVQFEVVDADPRRVKRLRVRLPGTIPATPRQPISTPAAE